MATGTKTVRGNVGVLIKVDMKEDMSAVTGQSFQVEKPKGGIVTWLCSINGNFLEYVTAAGDIDEVGDYKISPQLTKGSFDDGRGEPVFLAVVDKYKKT